MDEEMKGWVEPPPLMPQRPAPIREGIRTLGRTARCGGCNTFITEGTEVRAFMQDLAGSLGTEEAVAVACKPECVEKAKESLSILRPVLYRWPRFR